MLSQRMSWPLACAAACPYRVSLARIATGSTAVCRVTLGLVSVAGGGYWASAAVRAAGSASTGGQGRHLLQERQGRALRPGHRVDQRGLVGGDPGAVVHARRSCSGCRRAPPRPGTARGSCGPGRGRGSRRSRRAAGRASSPRPCASGWGPPRRRRSPGASSGPRPSGPAAASVTAFIARSYSLRACFTDV